MERNLRIYPWYQLFRNLFFWVPVFFLYFASKLSIDRVLLLESIYYGGVVLLEVPSGWFSDRIGRRVTLILSAAALATGYSLFALADGFGTFVAAQGCVAVAIAFNSGTDTSMLYDSLAAVGRGDEVAEHEARATRLAFGGYAIAALLGGASAGFDLRIAYALSAVGALGAFACAVAFREPEPIPGGARPSLVEAARRVRDPVLRWVLAFSVAMIVFEHVPFTFFQPYLDVLFGADDADGYQLTPLLSGVLVAVMMGLSALAAGRAVALRERLGAGPVLVGSLAVYIAVTGAMGAVVHPAVIAAIALRSVPMALVRPVVSGLVHPRIPTHVRATYLSLQSLAGRLAFSGALAGCAALLGPLDQLGPEPMGRLLLGFAAANLVVAVVLAATTRPLAD